MWVWLGYWKILVTVILQSFGKDISMCCRSIGISNDNGNAIWVWVGYCKVMVTGLF